MKQVEVLIGFCIAVVIILVMVIASQESVIEKLKVANDLEKKSLNIQTERIALYEEKVELLEGMIERDDILLNQFMYGTWIRSCEYELVDPTELADGSIRSSLIQTCEEGP